MSYPAQSHSAASPTSETWPVEDVAEHNAAASERPTSTLQLSLEGLVEAGFPAAIGTRTSREGGRESLAAGLADLASGQVAEPDRMVRMGSNAKMFTAVVVMQLVDEGRVELDGTIEAQLPRLVSSEGADNSRVTVRQLLQHTSGLPDYVQALLTDDSAFRRNTPPRDLLDLALTVPAVSGPGERWAYSNTNYLVLGMLIEHASGNSLEDEVTHRIIQPLKLERTFMPRGGDRQIPHPHLRGYHIDSGRVGLVDWTETDPSTSWGSGQIISTPAELNIFMQALLLGELTSADALQQMKKTVPADETFWPGMRYGLGLQRYPLSNGGTAWGHGGDFPGYQTRNAVNEDGTAVTISVTALPPAFIDPTDVPALMQTYRRVTAALNAALG